jgi:apolipoprotein D and lipocalin family protein
MMDMAGTKERGEEVFAGQESKNWKNDSGKSRQGISVMKPQIFNGLGAFSKVFVFLPLWFALLSAFVNAECPPRDFQSMDQLDLNEYTRAKWFVQEQMPVKYLPVSDNFCVTAQYVKIGNSKVSVFNYARRGGIEGIVRFAKLNAIQGKSGKVSELMVGPKFLPSFFYGPYWIIGAGKYGESSQGIQHSDHKYEWALVSGGAPAWVGENGNCKTGSGVNEAGLWILTRDPIVEEPVIENVRSFASEKGFDLTVLNRVVHEGCDYSF